VPSLNENRATWDDRYDWSSLGDEWSRPWGSPQGQWGGAILPRIRRFLPAPSILEIAPGMGRWTEFLLDQCDDFIGVDVAAQCVRACHDRFAAIEKATFYQNDGQTLPDVTSASVDFAFSFDSLVHVNDDVLASYVGELRRVLKPDGVAVLHHSNLGMYRRVHGVLGPLGPAARHLPWKLRQALKFLGVGLGSGWRDPETTSAGVAALCADSGLHCIGQELIPWSSGPYVIDCISTIARPGSHWDRECRTVKNRQFRAETRSIKNYFAVYSD
jgi:SAM-dependent methyltransferase